MVAQRILMQQLDGLASLKELVDVIKNPESIIEAHETAREQMALTESEQTKADEAREFIAKYAQLSKEIKDRHDALIIAQDELNSDRDSFTVEYQQKVDGLNQFKAELDAKATVQDNIEKNQNETQKVIVLKQSAQKQEFDELLAKLTAQAAENDKAKASNEANAAELAEYEKVLKAKAAKLREQAADI